MSITKKEYLIELTGKKGFKSVAAFRILQKIYKEENNIEQRRLMKQREKEDINFLNNLSTIRTALIPEFVQYAIKKIKNDKYFKSLK